MHSHTMRAGALLLCLAPAMVAFRAATVAMTLEPTSRIWISGTSTMKKFTCEAPAVVARIEATDRGAVPALLAGEKPVSTATITILAAKMDCANGTMNSHMTRALKANAFPEITFVLGGYEPAKSATGITGTIEGELTLGGTTRPVSMNALATDEGGLLRLTGAYALDMTDFGIKPPTLMMGTMKVGRTVKVHFDLLVKG